VEKVDKRFYLRHGGNIIVKGNLVDFTLYEIYPFFYRDTKLAAEGLKPIGKIRGFLVCYSADIHHGNSENKFWYNRRANI